MRPSSQEQRGPDVAGAPRPPELSPSASEGERASGAFGSMAPVSPASMSPASSAYNEMMSPIHNVLSPREGGVAPGGHMNLGHASDSDDPHSPASSHRSGSSHALEPESDGTLSPLGPRGGAPMSSHQRRPSLSSQGEMPRNGSGQFMGNDIPGSPLSPSTSGLGSPLPGGGNRQLGLPLSPQSSMGGSSIISNSKLPVVRTNEGARPRRMPLLGALAHGDKMIHKVGDNRSTLQENTYLDPNKKPVCNMCGDNVAERDDDDFVPCECSFRMCSVCLEHVRKYEKNRCPGCTSELQNKEQWLAMQYMMSDDDGAGSPGSTRTSSLNSDVMAMRADKYGDRGQHYAPMHHKASRSIDAASDSTYHSEYPLQVVHASAAADMVPVSLADYGYGSVAWETPPEKAPERSIPIADIKKRGLFRKVPYPGNKIGPYRIFVLVRFLALCGFTNYRITTPTPDGYWLWITSVICEVWFFVSWILDTVPKLSPVLRETYKDRLRAIYDEGGAQLPQVDIFITTADAFKEPPLVTACTILSVLCMDYPTNKLACYLSDDGAGKLSFDSMAETAGFARLWVPFTKKFDIEPRNPEMYFSQKLDFLKDKIQPDFVKSRRKVKREYEEFKVRVNALVADARVPPPDGFKMKDGTPWPGNNRRNHDGIIQVFLHPDGDVRDVDGNHLPPLVYVSREKRPGHEHNKKAGAMNALLRASGLITNGPFMMNLDCDHYVNNAQALREALCFFLDPIKGYNVGFVQFPQRFDGIDKSDRYANHNTIFFDVNMKGLDGQQGPVYVGTGTMFRRKALYGYFPSNKPGKALKEKHGRSCCQMLCCCCCRPKKAKKGGKMDKGGGMNSSPGDALSLHVEDNEKTGLVKGRPPLPARLGMCAHFVSTATGEEDMQQPLSPRSMLSDVVLSISCDYEDNTDWGKTVGWMYGSVTEDILTGMKIHTRGWRSVYADPARACFKGSAPLNMTDRLHQVERWATGAVEIFFSGRNPMFSHWGTALKFTQRLAYFNNAVYPFTSVAIFAYCCLPPLALLTDLFFVPTLDRVAVVWFTVLILSFLATSILELRWSGVDFDAWWRNEQFWVIGGTSAHLAAVIQGLLKLVAGVEIAFTLTSKGGDDEDIDELHTFKFTWLLLPTCFIGLFNILGIVAGVGRVLTQNSSSQQWGKLLGKLAFSFWVIIHLYPFAKGLMGKRDKMPTIIIVWSVLLVITVSLLWSNFFSSNAGI